ncbi:MAG: RNA-directed DNA polymerase [Campylobacterales bacterium]|nr:RNA-directed DNA polymerase [Campylobacterales bacterium]
MLSSVSFRDLYDAYLACRRHKRGTYNALHFESRLIDHLFDLCDALHSGSYRPGRSVAFLAKDPKLREIFAADFKDRVVHHYLVPRLEAHYEPRFIHDVHSNRQGRGIHSAAMRLQAFMRSMGSDAWVLQCDIRNFFYSIDKTILLRTLHRDLSHSALPNQGELLWLANRILTHDVRDGVHLRGNPRRFAALPQHKSLLKLPRHLGLPIGNLTSQFFANVYLNAFDYFVKRQLLVKGYVRYVDDFVLVDCDPKRLQ